MKTILQVLDRTISTTSMDGIEYICITDIAKLKDNDRTAHIIGNWLRYKNNCEFFGIWEQLNNPAFKVLEFEDFKKEAGVPCKRSQAGLPRQTGIYEYPLY